MKVKLIYLTGSLSDIISNSISIQVTREKTCLHNLKVKKKDLGLYNENIKKAFQNSHTFDNETFSLPFEFIEDETTC